MREAAARWGLKTTFPGETVMNQQALLLHDAEKVIVSFRGTQVNRFKGIFWDVFTIDLFGHLEFGYVGQDLRPTTYEERRDKTREVSLYRFHSGFKAAFEMLWKLYELPSLIAEASAGGKPIWLTGHSLGGAIALLVATQLLADDIDVQGVYLFGAPRVGNSEFARDYDLRMGDRTFRFVNHADLVPRVPLFSTGYVHVGQLVYFDSAGTIHFDVSDVHAVADFWLRRLWRNFASVFTFKAHSMERYVALVERAAVPVTEDLPHLAGGR
ncbi:MAG: lipase family protein [candidate division NC10 bacterium]|nr:lipase family protein [candidate division NC10 bacterium]